MAHMTFVLGGSLHNAGARSFYVHFRDILCIALYNTQRNTVQPLVIVQTFITLYTLLF